MTDRGFTHPNFGNTVRVEVNGTEVRLIFVADSRDKANNLADAILLNSRAAQSTSRWWVNQQASSGTFSDDC